MPQSGNIGRKHDFEPGSLLVPVSKSEWIRQTRLQNFAQSIGFNSWLLLKPSTFRNEGGQRTVPEGSYVLDKSKGVIDAEKVLGALAKKLSVSVIRTAGFFQAVVLRLSNPTIGVLSDAGEPYPFYDVLKTCGFQCVPISSGLIRSGDLGELDALIIPGGAHKGPTFQSAILRKVGRIQLGKFARRGGAVWGSCAGAINLVHLSKRARERLSSEAPELSEMTSSELANANYWGNGDTGIGILRSSVEDPSHPLVLNVPKVFDETWHLGPLLSERKGAQRKHRAGIVKCVGITDMFTAAEDLHSRPRNARRRGVYAHEGVKARAYAITLSQHGKGMVAASGGHPELGLDFLMEHWGIPAKILVNFVHVATASARTESASAPAKAPKLRQIADLYIGSSLNDLAEISTLAAKLRHSTRKTVWWLSPKYAHSGFGQSAKRNWPLVLRRIERALSDLPPLLQRTREALQYLMSSTFTGAIPSKRITTLYERIRSLLFLETAWLEEDLTGARFMQLDQPTRDYGWQTVSTLLANCKMKLLKAQALILAGPVDGFLASPYMLIQGMGTGAVYDLMNAEAMLRRRLENIDDFLFLLSESVGHQKRRAPT
jgi:hypothetical protein